MLATEVVDTFADHLNVRLKLHMKSPWLVDSSSRSSTKLDLEQPQVAFSKVA